MSKKSRRNKAKVPQASDSPEKPDNTTTSSLQSDIEKYVILGLIAFVGTSCAGGFNYLAYGYADDAKNVDAHEITMRQQQTLSESALKFTAVYKQQWSVTPGNL